MAETSTHPAATRSAQLPIEALALARAAHSGQRRKQSGGPFIEHPVAVARLLEEAGFGDEVVAAGYLHDVVEKSDVGLGLIRERFGTEVADAVGALSEDPSVGGYDERKRVLRRQVLAAGRPATVIYAADRVANLRDWTAIPPGRRPVIAASLGTSLAERLRLWSEDLAELSAGDPDLPFLGEIELRLRELAGGSDGAGPGAAGGRSR